MMGKKDVRYVAWKDEEKYMYCGNCGKKKKMVKKSVLFVDMSRKLYLSGKDSLLILLKMKKKRILQRNS